VKPELLDLLACPRCGKPLEAATAERLVCIGCGAAYPVRDGVAILLVEATSSE
jgi:uncharacterized protein YbaR (Trm112 family)